jgi:hypothetical protein
MGFTSKNVRKDDAPAPTVELTKAELELILRVLGTATFPVKEIEKLYTAIFKLQQIYKTLDE